MSARDAGMMGNVIGRTMLINAMTDWITQTKLQLSSLTSPTTDCCVLALQQESTAAINNRGPSRTTTTFMDHNGQPQIILDNHGP